MAKKKYEEANIQAIAEAIREKTGTEQTYMTSEMASGVAEVYDKGREDFLDALWENMQNGGKRQDYKQAFCHTDLTYMWSWKVWTDEVFAPKYDFKPTTAYRMFQNCGVADFKGCLAKNGVTIDLSNCKTSASVDMTYYFSRIRELPEVNISNVPGTLVETICWNERLQKVDKVILSSTGTQEFTATFENNAQWTEVVFEGVIGRSISFKNTALNPASLKSIISCLKDYSTENTGVYTITIPDNLWTALEADSSAPDGKTWREYVEYTLGWNT